MVLIGVTHTKYFDRDLRFGEKYEHELQSAIEGQIECKTDRLCRETGNVFIEIESRGKASGIEVTTSKYFAICLWVEERKDNTWVLISTEILKKLMKNYPIKTGGDNWSSKGHIIPKADLLDLII